MQQMYFVNEKNLYKVIMRSDKPQAEPFQDWVCGEVLPSIRKHGAYMSEQVIERTLSDPDYLIQLATTLKDERKARLEAEQRAAALTVENIEKQNKIEADKPKVTFADAIIGSRTSCLIGQLAKVLSQNGYKIGQNRLFKWLRDNHYLGSWGSYYNLPYQVYVEQGLFEVKYTTHSENERMVTSATTKVTGKGQQYFINLFINKQPILI
jgi:anti-repressor protein